MTNESKPFLKHMGTCFLQKPHQSLGNHSLMSIANEVGAAKRRTHTSLEYEQPSNMWLMDSSSREQKPQVALSAM
jgi:hypothetical protein